MRFIDKSQIHIKTGLLNLVFVASLTKFAQLGMDKMSAGLVAYYNNNNEHWHTFNIAMQNLKKSEPVAQLTRNYFSMFFLYLRKEQIAYQNRINAATQWFYQRVNKLLHTLEIRDQYRALTLTMNTDPYTCYIGLNYNDFYNFVDRTLCVSDHKWQEFNQSILADLIMPLAEVLGLDLTNRTSFGFPQANIACTANTIRFTLGIEDQPILEKYSEVFAYACFVINRLSSPDQLLSPVFRENYFKSRIDIFKAMSTPDYFIEVWKNVQSGENQVRYIVGNGTIRITHLSRRIGPNNQEYYTPQEINTKRVTVSAKDNDRLWWQYSSFEQKCIAAHLEDLKTVSTCGIRQGGPYITEFQWSSFFYIRPGQMKLRPSYQQVGSTNLKFEFDSTANCIIACHPGISGNFRLCVPDNRMVVHSGNKKYLVSNFSHEKKLQLFINLSQNPFYVKSDKGGYSIEFLGDYDVHNQNGIRINTKVVDNSRGVIMLTLDFWGIKARDLAGFCRGILLSYIKDVLNIPLAIYRDQLTGLIDCNFKRIYLDEHDMRKKSPEIIEMARLIYQQRNLVEKEMSRYQELVEQTAIPMPLTKEKTYSEHNRMGMQKLSHMGSDEFMHCAFFKKLLKIITDNHQTRISGKLGLAHAFNKHKMDQESKVNDETRCPDRKSKATYKFRQQS